MASLVTEKDVDQFIFIFVHLNSKDKGNGILTWRLDSSTFLEKRNKKLEVHFIKDEVLALGRRRHFFRMIPPLNS